MPSTSASVVSTSSAPRSGEMTAASSPGPTTTHGGMASRAVMRAISACSPREETVGYFKKEKPRFAVWGGRVNLRKQVEPLFSAALQASSVQRHAQRATSRLTWVKHRLRRASENHHEQSRSSTHLSVRGGVGQGGLTRLFISDLRQNLVDEALQPHGPLVELAVGFRLLRAGAEIFVGDIERDEHREPQGVAARRRIGGGAHLPIDVGRELRDVTLVERAPDWITLPGDLDRHDARRQMASSCSSISATRARIRSRSSRSAVSSVLVASASASRARNASSSCVSRALSPAVRACSARSCAI